MTKAQFERILSVLIEGCISLERNTAFFQELAARMRGECSTADKQINRALAARERRKDKRIERMN